MYLDRSSMYDSPDFLPVYRTNRSRHSTRSSLMAWMRSFRAEALKPEIPFNLSGSIAPVTFQSSGLPAIFLGLAIPSSAAPGNATFSETFYNMTLLAAKSFPRDDHSRLHKLDPKQPC